MPELEVVAPTPTQSTVETADRPDVAEPEQTTEAETPKPEAERPIKTAEQKELEALRRARTKAERNNARLWEENQRLQQTRQAPPQAGEPPQPQKFEVSREEFEQATSRRAQEIASARELASRCNDVLDKGTTKFPDFTDMVKVVGAELPLFDRNNQPTPALEEVLDSRDPVGLLRYLGQNPDIAAELSDLSPRQLTRRLVTLESEIAKPTRERSSAPDPHEPEKPAAASSSPDPEKNPAAWREWRNKNAKAR